MTSTLARRGGGSALLSALLSFFVIAFVWALVPGTAHAADPDEIWVNGENIVTAENNTVQCGGGTAVYDPATNILTLNDVDITKSKSFRSHPYDAGVYVETVDGPFTIILNGENSIDLTDASKNNHGIWVDAVTWLTIEGPGRLDILLGGSGSPYCIYNTQGPTSIEGATIDCALAEGLSGVGSVVEMAYFSDKNQGVSLEVVLEGATVIASGFEYGIWATDAMFVEDSTIVISSCDASLYTGWGELSLLGSSVRGSASYEGCSALCAWGDTVIEGSVVEGSAVGNGLYSFGDVLVSEGSTVRLSSTGSDALTSSAGVFVSGESAVTVRSASGAGAYTGGVLSVSDGSTLLAEGVNWAVLARRLSSDDQANKPAEDPTAIAIGSGLVERGGATVKTQDWEYRSVWDSLEWDYVDKWESLSWFVDAEGAEVTAIEITASPADYSAVEIALAKVPADLSAYTETSAQAVRDAVNAVEYGKPAAEQDAVDAMAKAIEDAVAALEKKPAVTPYAPPSVTVEESDGGKTSVVPSSPLAGDEVVVATEPEEGNAVIEVFVTDAAGNQVEVTDNGDGTYSYVQPAGGATVSVTYGPEHLACLRDHACPIHPFEDANTAAWYHDGMHWAILHGIVRGYDSGLLGAEESATRAQVVTMLWRMAGEPAVSADAPFSDVAPGKWYSDAVAWAHEVGLTTGYTAGEKAGSFGLADVMTREQMAVVLYRFVQLNGCDVSVGADTNILSYADALEISSWAVEAIQWACGAGVISGYTDASGELTGYLGPQDDAQRCQFAAMLQRMDDRYEIL